MYTIYKWTQGRAVLLPAAYAVRAFNAVSRAVRGRRGSRDAATEWVALGKSRVDLLRKYGILDAVSAGSEETDRSEKGQLP